MSGLLPVLMAFGIVNNPTNKGKPSIIKNGPRFREESEDRFSFLRLLWKDAAGHTNCEDEGGFGFIRLVEHRRFELLASTMRM